MAQNIKILDHMTNEALKIENSYLDLPTKTDKQFDNKRFKLEKMRKLFYDLDDMYGSSDSDGYGLAYGEYDFLSNVLSSRDYIKIVNSKSTDADL